MAVTYESWQWPDELSRLRASLLRFYQKNKRDLPWRRTQDPYAIWVSEIMLQQTQVDTVVPRYQAFLKQFPTVQTLAAATEEQVCEAWAGLGYYRRARHLWAGACQICEDGGGRFPSDVSGWMRIKGVGAYTAGAIVSIAYQSPAPIVDGNVNRVLTRLMAWDGDVAKNPLKARIWDAAAQYAQGVEPGDANQALMELGATVCKPVSPRCDRCPWQASCQAALNDTQQLYPTPIAKKARQKMNLAYAIVADEKYIWMWRRPKDGLWPNLWEPVSAETKGSLHARWGIKVGRKIGEPTHILTHREVSAPVYRSTSFRAERLAQEGAHAIAFSKLSQLGISALGKKVLTLAGFKDVL